MTVDIPDEVCFVINPHEYLRLASHLKNPIMMAWSRLDHIGFQVEDARESFSDLVSKGARPAVKPFYDGGWWMAFVQDADGIWIELISRAGHRLGSKIWGVRSSRSSPS